MSPSFGIVKPYFTSRLRSRLRIRPPTPTHNLSSSKVEVARHIDCTFVKALRKVQVTHLILDRRNGLFPHLCRHTCRLFQWRGYTDRALVKGQSDCWVAEDLI